MRLRSTLAWLTVGALSLVGCRDLAVPPTPQFASLAGAIDTGGHQPPGDNQIRLINATSGVRADQRTDADGGFLFGGLPPGPYLVQADVPGFAPLREGPFIATSGAAIDTGVFVLAWLGTSQSEGSISGSVVVAGGSSGSADAGSADGGLGRPSDAMGATVTLLLERTGAEPAKVAETPVDAFGRFSSRVPPGRYTIEATHPWYVSARRTGVALGEAQLLELDQPLVLELNPADLTGEVVLELENFSSGATTRPGAGVTISSDTGISVTADSSGRYTLPGLAAGTRRITFSLPGFHDSNPARTVSLTAGEHATFPQVKLLLDRGDISGRVRMSDGSPVDDVSVFIAGAADGGSGSYSAQAVRSASDPTAGEFILRDIPVAPYNVTAHRTNYVDATSPTVNVRAGEVTRVTDELRLARLQGDFLIDDGDPANTAGFTRVTGVTLVLSNVTNAAEFRVVEGSQQALQAAPWQPYVSPRLPFSLSSGDAAKTVYLQIKNTMGNEGAALSATIVLDTTPPSSASLLLASGAAFTRLANPLPVTLSALDNGGVAFVHLAAVEPDGGLPTTDAGVPDGGFPELAAPRLPYTRDTAFQRPSSADGVQQVAAQFIDNAGNLSDLVLASIVVDTVAPTGSLSVLRGARATLDGYTNSLLVELAETWGSEPHGGFVQVRLANDAVDLANAPAQAVRARASWFLDAQGEGTKTVHYRFVDAAGNQSSGAQATIIYDATAPLLNATLLSANPTANPLVTIGLSTVETSPYSPDAGVSLSESSLFTNAQTQAYPSNDQVTWSLTSGDGSRDVFVKVRDAAGNDSSASLTVQLDTTAPTGLGLSLVGALRDGTSSSSLTALGAVTVNLSHSGATRLLFGDGNLTTCPALDATWATITGNSVPNHPLPGTGPTRTVTACFADGAGNVAGPVSASIEYDGAAPTGCQLTLTGLRTDGLPSGSARTALRTVPFSLTNCDEPPLEIATTEQSTVTCNATTSGLVWAPYSTTANQLTLSSVDGTKTVRGCVRDAARNTVGFTLASLTLDATPPTNTRVVLNAGASYVNAAGLVAGVAVASVAGTAVGATEWAIAEEGTTPSNFVDFATQNPLSLALSAGDGEKTVLAMFRDDLGNTISVEARDSIEVDGTLPLLTAFSLSGNLADGTASTTTTTSADVTANLAQTGATTVFLTTSTLTACPPTGHSTLTGSTAPVTLSATGTRTYFACVGDAAGNVSAVRSATITYDSVGPTDCALVLTGLRADDAQPTSGAGLGRTGRRDVPYTLSGCVEQPVQIALTESTVNCSANSGLVWALYDSAAANSYALSGIDGAKTLRGCVRDAARNTVALTAASITLDTTPPTGTSVLLDNGASYVNAAQKALRLNLNQASALGTVSGATEWALAEGATPSTWRPASGAGHNPFAFEFSAGDGVKTVRALFRDEVGNLSVGEVSDSIEFDTLAPTLSSVTVLGTLADGAPSTITTATDNVTANLSHSGGTRIAFSNAATLDCSTASFTPFSGTSVSTTLAGSGSPRRLTVCISDEAGNAPVSVTDTILFDNTPASNCALVLSGRTATGGTTTLDKTALREVPFAFSGCGEVPTEVFLTEAPTVDCAANLDWKPLTGTDTVTLSPVDGDKTVRGCVRDAARNFISLVGSDTITLDTTPPTAATVSLLGGGAWFNAADFAAATPANTNSIPVTGTASGATAWALAEGGPPSTFVAFTSPTTSTFTFSTGNGTKTVRALFRDDVGNVTSSEVTDSIEVDTGVPAVSSLVLTGTLADGTSSSAVSSTTTVTATLTQTGATRVFFGDATLTVCPATGYVDFGGSSASTTLTGSGSTRTVKACVADAAGNVAGPVTDTIALDTATPTSCQLVLTGRRADGSNTSGGTAELTALRDVGVSLSSCNDTVTEIYLTENSAVSCTAVNGFTWLPYNAATLFTLSSVDVQKRVYGCVRDAAFNTSGFVSDTITLDTTPPSGATVSIKGGAAYFNTADFLANTPDSNSMSVTGSATDAVEWAIGESAPTVFTAWPATGTILFSAGEGTRTVYALFRDAVGNVTPVSASDSIEVDLTAPTLTSVALTGSLADGTPSETNTVSAQVQLGLVHSGGVGLYLGDGTLSACPSSGYTSFGGGTSASITLPGSGAARTVRACISDAAGNVAGYQQDSLTLDAVAPANCVLTLVGRRADGTNTSGGTAELTALRDVGVSLSSCNDTVTEISLTENSAVSCTAVNGFTWLPYNAATLFTLSSVDVQKRVYGCVRDAANNTSGFTSDTITLDTTPPSGATVSIKGGAAYFNAADFLANTPDSNSMSVTGSATDAVEWAIAESATPSAFSAWPSTGTVLFTAGEGTRTVSALFRDAVGNVTPVGATDSIEVDLTPPTLTSVALTGSLADGTPSDTNTVTALAQLGLVHSGGVGLFVGDGTLSACPPTGYTSFGGGASASITLPGSGATRTVRACLSDVAGNVAGYQEDSITLDAVAPANCALTLVGRRVDGTNTSGGTANKTAQTLVGVSLGASCTETPTEVYLVEAGSVGCSATASLSWQTFTVGATNFALTGGDLSKNVVGCVRDAARNVSTLLADTIVLDTTPPSGASISLHGGAAYFNNAAFVANTPDSNQMNLTGTATGAAEWAWAETMAPTSFGAFTTPTTLAIPLSALDGTKTVRALFRDDVGNTTPAEASDTIEVDTQLPVLTSISVSGALADGTASTTLTTTAAVTVSLNQAGATLVAVGDSTFTCPTTLAGFGAFNGTTTSTTLTDATATRTVRACVADAAGNFSTLRSATITYDATVPASCALTLGGRRVDGSSTAGSVPEKTALASIAATLTSCSETPADIYLVETASAVSCPAAGSAVWQTLSGGLTIGTTLTSGDALKTVKACVRDAARNVSAATFQDTITLDSTPPTGASVSLHAGADWFNRAAWLAGPNANRMGVTGTASGATEWAYAEGATPTSFGSFPASPTTVALTFSTGDGTKRVYALFRDDVGNTTPAEASDSIEVDTAVPTLSTITLTGTLGDGTASTTTTNTAAVTASFVQSGGVSFAYGDGTFTCPNGTAFTAFNGSTTPVTLPGSGTPRTVTACVADAAGNASSVRSDAIDYDALAPSGCSVVLTGRRVDGVATVGGQVDLTALRDVGVSVSGCADSNLQVALTEAGSVTCSNSVALTWVPLLAATTFQLSSGDGSKTVRGCVRDPALNVGSLGTDSITLDTTPPDSPVVTLNSTSGYSSSFNLVASGTADGAAQWVVATSAAGPFTSYVSYTGDPTNAAVSFASPDGTKTVYAKFRDALLNTTATVTASVIVDATPPTAPVLLTIDGQNRGARLFWDPSTDTNGILRYELLSDPTGTPTTVRNTTAGTATDGYVLNLENRTDQVFAVRAIDNAGNPSALSSLMSTTIGWRRTAVNPGSIYPIRPLDIALRGSDVFVTYMETDTNWAGTAGTLWMAVSHDRGTTWSFKALDAYFGAGRSQAPIAFTDNAVWVASVSNPGLTSDVTAGEVKLFSSTTRGDSWTTVSVTGLNDPANYGKVDGLGLFTSGSAMRLRYLLASATATKQMNTVFSDGSTSSATLVPDYDVSSVFGYAPYQVTNGLRSCSGNFSSLTLWRDRSTTSGSSPNLNSVTHYYLPDNTYTAPDEGFSQWVTAYYGTGEEVGNFDLACTPLSETMQAYLVYDRAPAAAWAVGSNGTILKYDDTAWVTAPSPTQRYLNSVQDVWALGDSFYADSAWRSLILKWNGSAWEQLDSTVGGSANLNDSWTYTASSVFAVGTGGTIIRWNGSTWAAMTSGTANSLYGVWGTTSSNVLAVGNNGTVRRWDGSTWTAMTSTTTANLRAVWGSSSTNVFAVGSGGTIIRWNGTVWAAVASGTTQQLNSIWGSSSTNIWAVGAGGTSLRWNGTAWSTVTSGTTATLNEVSGVSSGDVWAVGTAGTAIHFNGSSWSAGLTETTADLNSVWWGGSSGGPAANLYARRKLGSLQTFTDPETLLRSDADRSMPPQIWAGSRNVYVLYRATSDKLWLGESTNEGTSYDTWTTLEAGANKGLYGVLAGDNSSDVAVAFTDVNAATFTVMIPALASFPLTPLAGVSTGTLSWATVPGVDRYQIDSDPDGQTPWANVDFTSLTQATVPMPPGLAPYVQVRAVDPRGMPGNTGELWQLRPFGEVQLTSTTAVSSANSNSGGVVAYNDRALVWPPWGTTTAGDLQIWRTANYGATWTTYNPFPSVSTTSSRAIAGFNGRAAVFYEDSAVPNTLRVLVYGDLNAAIPTAPAVASGVNIDHVSAKASVDNTGLVVAYSDMTNDLIRVSISDSVLGFTAKTAIATTAANTIGTVEVAKVDFSQNRIVITWREYNSANPRTDLIRGAESLDRGTTWGAPFTLLTGDSSSTSEPADYTIGSTTLSGANNGAYSVLARTSEFNDFNEKQANLYLTVTGTDHSSNVSSSSYVNFKLDSETVDTRTIDAFANSDGHYLAYRSETLDGTTVKLRFAYCFSDCHLFQSWDRSLLKVWTSYVKDQGRFVAMTVGQTSSTAYDPAVYVLYQEAAGTTRNLKVLTRGVHRRSR